MKFGKKDSFSDAEISSLAVNLLANYRKGNSALKSLEISSGGDLKYKRIAILAKRYLLSNAEGLEKSPFTETNLNILLKIIHIGIITGTDISKNLEDFAEWMDAKMEKENKIRSKVNGMQILSLVGIVFFFPLFSGITASIVRSSLTGISAGTIVNGLRLIGMGYIVIATLITNSLLKPARTIVSLLRDSLPMALFGCILQTVAYTFSSYAI